MGEPNGDYKLKVTDDARWHWSTNESIDGNGEPPGYSQLFVKSPTGQGDGRWNTNEPPQPNIMQGVGTEGGPLKIEEDYGFDTKGYLHLRALLSADDVTALRAGKTEILRKHLALNRYLDLLMAEGNSRMPESGAPCKLANGEVQPLVIPTEPIPGARLTGGVEMQQPSRGYIQNEGHRFAQGVRVIAALTAAPENSGGFVLVPCSHKLCIDAPESLLTMKDDMSRLSHPIIVQPTLEPGDVLLCVSTLIHGVQHWRGSGPPATLLHCEYTGQVAASGEFSDEQPWMVELTPEQRVVLGLRAPGREQPAAVVSDGVTVRIGPDAAEYHPRRLEVVDNPAIDADEQFFWELNGFIVLRGVMTPQHLAAANAALDELETQGIVRGNEDGTRYTMEYNSMMTMEAPLSTPFRQMLAHPTIVKRLNWILGGGFRCNRTGNLIDWRGDWRELGKGNEGHRFHAGGHPVLPEFVYHRYQWQNGRSYAGSCNVAWQLHPTSAADGGHVMVPGSHKSAVPNFEEDPFDPTGHRGAVHPVMDAGDVLLFMGGSTTHGATAWTNKERTRRVAIVNYLSAHIQLGRL